MSASATLFDDGTRQVHLEGDTIVVALPSAPPLRVRRAHLLGSTPMLGRIARERGAPPLPREHDEDILVALQLESEPTRWLGPFPHRMGLALGRALDLARRDVLLATPRFAVTVAHDGASLVVDVGGMSIPVPTAYLVALRTKSTVADARHRLPTSFGPELGSRHVEVAFAHGRPWAIGPLPVALAERLCAAFQEWRERHPIDREPVDLEMQEIVAAPARWHRRRIRVVGTWSFGFERSSFGPVWLSGREPAEGAGEYRVRVTGTLTYPDEAAFGGYGHLGGSAGELEAESIEVLEARPASRNGGRDGLTGLLTRAAWFPRAEAAALAGRACIALLDLDRFKRVNDVHGHLVGDDVLRAWAKLVSDALGERAVVARFGGEELAVVFAAGTSLEDAEHAVADVLARIRASTLATGAATVTITCSAGVTETGAGETARDALARCDEALVQAKGSGRDRVVVCPAPRR